jgi:hypothetical protein
MLSWFIGWEDWVGINSNSVATDNNENGNNNAEAGEYACNFLKVALR